MSIPKWVPFWYRYGIAKQLTVRLRDDLVAFIDARVELGQASSRAAVIASAIEREQRREVSMRDADILAASADDDGLDGLVAFAARTPLDDFA